MDTEKRVIERLAELVLLGEQALTRMRRTDESDLATQWYVSTTNILVRAFGSQSLHYSEFKSAMEYQGTIHIDEYTLRAGNGVLRAALDDMKGGHLIDVKKLLESEVFSDFMEQAQHLMECGYYKPAAVIIGCVLEDGLRRLCDNHNIPIPDKATIEPLNVLLAKAGVYNKLTQKKMTANADIRNNAAHGKWNDFTDKDVEDMLSSVSTFMQQHFGSIT